MPKLHIRCIKFFADGALGSRGAWMLEPYSDDAGNCGIAFLEKETWREQLHLCKQYGFQVATHAIGDAANRFVLDSYAEVLQGKNDLRWRIEHAQIVQDSDIDKFGQYNILPSVQPTHCTSDMNWLGERIGENRTPKAYRNKELLLQNGLIASGTDFPIEHPNPLYSFYAAITRKNKEQANGNKFCIENALSRKETLQSMTIWAAYFCLEEKEKGSLEKGKWADFIILDLDLMTCDMEEVLKAKVKETWLGGERVY